MDSPGISRDSQSYFDDIGVAGGIDGSPEISRDCHSYFGVMGYSDMGVGGWVDRW